MDEVRHGGCYRCKSKQFPVLWSVSPAGIEGIDGKAPAIAVCPTAECVPPTEAKRLAEMGILLLVR